MYFYNLRLVNTRAWLFLEFLCCFNFTTMPLRCRDVDGIARNTKERVYLKRKGSFALSSLCLPDDACAVCTKEGNYAALT